MNRDHRYNTPEEKAFGDLMEAAKGLDRLCYGSDLEPWRDYQRAYYAWLEVRA